MVLPAHPLGTILVALMQLPTGSWLLPQSWWHQDCPLTQASPVEEEVPPGRAPHPSQGALSRGGPVPPLPQHRGTAPNIKVSLLAVK